MCRSCNTARRRPGHSGRTGPSGQTRLPHLAQFLLHLGDLVAQTGRDLELEVRGCGPHTGGQVLDLCGQLRRREKQVAYNKARGIDPQPLRKKINDIVAQIAREDIDTEELLGSGYRQAKKDGGAKAPVPSLGTKAAKGAKGAKGARGKAAETAPTDRPAAELAEQIEELTTRMRAAAADLQFEIAARLRDEVSEMKKELRQMKEAGLA